LINLIGTYNCKSDAKGRLAFPAVIKNQLENSFSDGFVIKKSVFEPCLELFPMAEWNRVSHQIGTLNRFTRTNNSFIRRFNAGVKIVSIDANGRLLIPKDLLEFAGVQKEIVVSSTINILEIWSKHRYENSINNAVEDFAALAEKVMSITTNIQKDVS